MLEVRCKERNISISVSLTDANMWDCLWKSHCFAGNNGNAKDV